MKKNSGSAAICMGQIARTFKYGSTPILTMEINYPEVYTPNCVRAGNRILQCFQNQVKEYCRHAEGTLCDNAVKDYCYANKMGYPFNPYELTVQYTVAYNDSCCLSVFRDAYRYTGGAHGVTPRASDTFDLRTGDRICLNDLFHCTPLWPSTLLGVILAQAEEMMRQNPNIFFENYRELILRNFCAESFYLSPAGITIYYQQYDIGPYVSGIVEFTVPFQQVGATPPGCGC